MTDPDPDRPHVVTAPHRLPHSGTWWAACSCGVEFMAGSAEEVREAGRPHRDAGLARGGEV